MCKGMVFNIQKFSIHDGPGIRTTVFLKGCPLRCRWCSNPESQLSKTQILYDASVCIQDGACIKACPQQAVQRKGSRIVIDDAQCLGCLRCIATCKAKALQVEGVCRDADEVVATCLQDRDFYEESQGGVTLSGGEALAQPSFAKALVLRLKQEGIHVAVETTGYIQPAVFQKLAPLFDLLLFDIKHYDTEQHVLGTGVNNDLILENLAWSVKHQLCVLPRIPIIPEITHPCRMQKALLHCLHHSQFNGYSSFPFISSAKRNMKC